MRNPLKRMSSKFSRPVPGAVGYSLSVSLSTMSMYFSRPTSSNVSSALSPKTSSSSRSTLNYTHTHRQSSDDRQSHTHLHTILLASHVLKLEIITYTLHTIKLFTRYTYLYYQELAHDITRLFN